jgi:hypothetical protein
MPSYPSLDVGSLKKICGWDTTLTNCAPKMSVSSTIQSIWAYETVHTNTGPNVENCVSLLPFKFACYDVPSKACFVGETVHDS